MVRYKAYADVRGGGRDAKSNMKVKARNGKPSEFKFGLNKIPILLIRL